MPRIFLSYNNIISNLGFDSKTVVDNMASGISGLHNIDNPALLPEAFCASIIPTEKLNEKFEPLGSRKDLTKLEQMMILSLYNVIETSKTTLDETVGLIISTTKGNIDVLENETVFPKSRAYLSELGKTIQNFFGFKNEAVIISNACVSGILAISAAKKFISQGKYNKVFIVSGDLVSKFVLSGFHSFQALSSSPCRPYDKSRNGINLGEVAASVLVTVSDLNLVPEAVEILGDATCNDANHISGPSRTGEGLYRSVTAALKEANLNAQAVDYISAHGTATSFNDEMEAIAFDRLALNNVPINSLKGYFGHTLGASGLLETIIGMHQVDRKVVFASKGFEELGVSKKIYVLHQNLEKELKIFLKTASGFGGCNTAAIFKRVNS